MSAAERIATRFSMRGRRALVTGGSLSIGRAIVLAFADAGAEIAIQFAPAADAAMGVADGAGELASILTEVGARHVLVPADFAIAGEGTRAFETAEAVLGTIDVLVLCASIQQRTAFVDVSAEERDRQTRVNFYATVELLQAAVPGMSVEQDNKAIVGRWFTNFWGKTCDLTVVDEIAAPEMLLHYSLHEPRRGREDIKAFMTDRKSVV